MDLRLVPVFGNGTLTVAAVERRVLHVEQQAAGLAAVAAAAPIAVVVVHQGRRRVLSLDGTEADLGSLRRAHPELDAVLEQLDAPQPPADS